MSLVTVATDAEKSTVVRAEPVVSQVIPPRTTIQRLMNPMPDDRVMGWVVTLVITLIAFGLRLFNLATPRKLAFDETYYAKNAWTLLHNGFEMDYPDKIDDLFNQGQTPPWSTTASYVVHPPMGKWFIAIGEQMFGMNSFGWRFMACVFGALMVLGVIRLTRRISRSTLIGAIAGILITFDGLAFVMSRLALLDIFQATLIVLGVSAMVADRDWFRERLARYLTKKNLVDLGGQYGPAQLWRPWRLAAGVLFGLACGVKWNSAVVLAAMCVLTLFWDVSARRLAGMRGAGRAWGSFFADGSLAFAYQVLVGGIVYVLTWLGWFIKPGGWVRDWGTNNPNDLRVKLFGPMLGSWLEYHKQVWEFHNGDYIKQSTHPYAAHPASWLIMGRPIGIDSVEIAAGTQGCPSGGDKCYQVITAMGTPVLWWVGLLALIAGLFLWIFNRDWRFSVAIVPLGVVLWSWWLEADRPLYFFYAICLIPFTCVALALILGKILGPTTDPLRRQVGAIIVGTILALIALNFAFIYPILSDQTLTNAQWQLRMWFNSWI